MATMARSSHLFIDSMRCSRLTLGSFRHKATAASARPEEDVDVKPFSQIPGPKGLPIIGTLLEAAKTAGESHIWIAESHKEYGPIYRNKAGVLDMVFIADADAVEQLLRQDGKYPQRLQLGPWLDYRRRHGIPTGLVMSEGQQWHRLRRVIDKPMLKIKTVNSYAADLNKVTADFIDRLGRVRSSDNSIPQLDEELFSWSMESIGTVLFEKRLGCLCDNRDPDAQALIDSSHTTFEAARKLVFLPPWLGRIFKNKVWKQHENAWDTLFRVAFKMIDTKIKEIEAKADKGGEVGFLASFLQEKSLSLQDVYSNVSELMGAAIDTTSNTTQMLLYEVSRNPDVQKALLEEVNRIVPPGEQPTPVHFKDMHYLKALIKETLRVHPTNTGVFRVLSQDAEVLGYKLPKGTTIAVHLYVMGHHPKYYDDPETFRPERWLREDGKSSIHPFAWLPFGFGSRMCVGRRVAELEIQLLISQLVRKFNIEPVSNEPIQMKTDLLLLPKTPVRIRLTDRS